MKDMLSEKMITLCFYRELNMSEIQLIRITDPYGKTWEKAMEIYESSFPVEEKRPYEKHLQLVRGNDSYHFYAATEGEMLIGIVILWKLEGFIYLDYLATLSNARNKGYGKRIVEQVKEIFNEPIILEVELPDNDLSQRRIGFYTRLGFHLLNFHYFMPKYNNPKEKFPMLLMSFPYAIEQVDYEHVIMEIHTNAYNVDWGQI
jgi:ribosomal protein S18 acetylase RimI-like enzyme